MCRTTLTIDTSAIQLFRVKFAFRFLVVFLRDSVTLHTATTDKKWRAGRQIEFGLLRRGTVGLWQLEL
jgi:hypothetical protein